MDLVDAITKVLRLARIGAKHVTLTQSEIDALDELEDYAVQLSRRRLDYLGDD